LGDDTAVEASLPDSVVVFGIEFGLPLAPPEFVMPEPPPELIPVVDPLCIPEPLFVAPLFIPEVPLVAELLVGPVAAPPCAWLGWAKARVVESAKAQIASAVVFILISMFVE
jgi:hypothetical protein